MLFFCLGIIVYDNLLKIGCTCQEKYTKQSKYICVETVHFA